MCSEAAEEAQGHEREDEPEGDEQDAAYDAHAGDFTVPASIAH